MVPQIEPLVEPLTSKHIRSNFCCGENTLNDYICKQASQDLKRKAATVFVLVDKLENHSETKVLGYYSLSNYIVDIKELNKSLFVKNLPPYRLLPATLIGRLAVDSTQKGKRFGEFLLYDALKKSLAISEQIASLAVIAEAINEQAAQFYLKYGFQRFNHQSTKLYLPMKSIEKIP